ncbi:MAG: fluoride efflux transporter CrcB [Candidatus Marisimplicoccus sp.]
MKEVLLVFLGGGLGSSLRWLINKFIPSDTFPYSTISVNLIGCLLIGILAGYLLSHDNFKSDIYSLLVIGFCGGLTTFSAFALDNYNLIKSNDFFNTILYITLSVAGCIIMIYTGFYIIQKIIN